MRTMFLLVVLSALSLAGCGSQFSEDRVPEGAPDTSNPSDVQIPGNSKGP